MRGQAIAVPPELLASARNNGDDLRLDEVIAASAVVANHATGGTAVDNDNSFTGRYGFLFGPACIACALLVFAVCLFVMFVYGCWLPYFLLTVLLLYNSLYFFVCPESWTSRFKEITL